MKKIAIVIDEWKLDIISRHLQAAGFAFEKFDGPTAEVLTLRVVMSEVERLARVVREAQGVREAMTEELRYLVCESWSARCRHRRGSATR